MAAAAVIVVLVALLEAAGACSPAESASLEAFFGALEKKLPLNSSDCCLWEGVGCDADGTVTKLWLPDRALLGQISPSIANLSSLSHLNLSNNLLEGPLPEVLLSSASIVVLDLSFNRLNGKLPDVPPGKLRLRSLNVSRNSFNGSLPSSIWESFGQLAEVNVSNNGFTGSIPESLCAGSKQLAVVDMANNYLTGGVPRGLSNCTALRVFATGFNNLSGSLPESLFSIRSLEVLSMPSNALAGDVTNMRLSTLPNIQLVNLDQNSFWGQLPESIGQLKKLEVLLLNNNNLSGVLPQGIGNCTGLRQLELRTNRLSGNLSALNFSGLSNLEILDLYANSFTGQFPSSIYSCRSLRALRLANNSLDDNVPMAILNLTSLSFLSLSSCKLKNISATLQILKGCANLTVLLLAENFNVEMMPVEGLDGAFQSLRLLDLSNCNLTGSIPPWLSNLRRLEILLMNGNQLTGVIPPWIGDMPNLSSLSLSNNNLGGNLSSVLKLARMITKGTANATKLELPIYGNPAHMYPQLEALPRTIDLSVNNVFGEIPPEMGQLKELTELDISSNSLSGKIPVEVGNLTNLQKLILSNNSFSGEIPQSLTQLHFLSEFNVSYNDLEGRIPNGGQFDTFKESSFLGNPKLCGTVIGKNCTKMVIQASPAEHLGTGSIVAVVFASFFGVLAVVFAVGRCLVAMQFKDQVRRSGIGAAQDSLSTSSSDQIMNGSGDSTELVILHKSGDDKQQALTFADILKGTNNFNQEMIVGCGGFGMVYKAELPGGQKLAVKRLSGENCVVAREFKAEVEALSVAQHENLVALLGYCILDDARLLIYSYMENGSVDDWLHESADLAAALDWPTRLRIMQGAGAGLLYLHQGCRPHIVHRDIKSSNILLDLEFNAHVADFGLSRLIRPQDSHVTTELVGTLGYIPPEYGQAWVATPRGDVYSFGVVLLELLTGRRPVEVLPGESRETVVWVLEMFAGGRAAEVLDPALRREWQDPAAEKQMLTVLEVAVRCVSACPCRRPSIQEVVSWLDAVDAETEPGRSADEEDEI